MSIDWIKRNVKVYSKEFSLPLAQKIPGLRAVFGEAYPDPVRVVSLEYDVDEIAQDIENPKWRNTSIEFCGGTHVARTGDIKDFVITEESGIAKGIRRIVAVTGYDAQDVTRVADAFEARINQVELLTGKTKDTALKTLSVVCNVLTHLLRLRNMVFRNSARPTFRCFASQTCATAWCHYVRLWTRSPGNEKRLPVRLLVMFSFSYPFS